MDSLMLFAAFVRPTTFEWIPAGCAILSFSLLVLAAKFIQPHNRLTGRGDTPLPIQGLPKLPILQVELAWTAEQLNQVLRAGDLGWNIKDAAAGNQLDTFLFIPSYLALLVSVGLILAYGDQRWRVLLLIVALVAVPLAGICDWMENHGITTVLDKLKNKIRLDDHDATRISTPSSIKWTTLGVVLLIYGVNALRRLLLWQRNPACLVAWLGSIILGLGGLLLGAIILAALARYGLGRWRPQQKVR